MRRAVPAMRISIEPDTWWHRELQRQGIKVSRDPLADGLGFARICPTFREGS